MLAPSETVASSLPRRICELFAGRERSAQALHASQRVLRLRRRLSQGVPHRWPAAWVNGAPRDAATASDEVCNGGTLACLRHLWLTQSARRLCVEDGDFHFALRTLEGGTRRTRLGSPRPQGRSRGTIDGCTTRHV